MPGAPRHGRAAACLLLLLPLLLLLCGAEPRPGGPQPSQLRHVQRRLRERRLRDAAGGSGGLEAAALRRALRRYGHGLEHRGRAGDAASWPPAAAQQHPDPPHGAWTPRILRERRRRARGLQEEEEECGKSEGKCCLRSLKVSFQDIGWADWVVAPRSYDMRFCQGSCPHNYRAASMHAQVQARVHALARGAPAPCCVPAAYAPMVLMHYDAQGRLVSSVFEDMLVTKCHCA